MPQPPLPTTYLPQIADKLKFLRACIDQIQAQLHRRQQHQQASLSELEEKICEVQTAIYELDQRGGEQNNLLSRRRIHLDDQIKALEEEKRKQPVETWRDITTLERELRTLQKEYRAVRAGATCIEQMNSLNDWSPY